MLKIYNTLTKKEETFKPISPGKVGIYSCGPTVYNYAHIGNHRTNLMSDFLKRSLSYLGFKVNHVMNITDVDDKTIKNSKKENKSLKEFTRNYEKIFLKDLEDLNIILPNKIPRATESISDMISLIETLLKKGYAYKASDGVYFSISKFKKYGEIANLKRQDKTEKKSRITNDEYDKENAQDFALWKFHTEQDGPVYWEAPFGKGRPGWHIECSAMSMKALGKHFDIHTGGIDLIFPHHTNEIAQSECATGKKFVNYWLHGGFLTMKEGKMSKSLGNVYTLKYLKELGFSPIDYRYLCLQTHYRSPLQFSIENLEAAKTSFSRIKRKVIELKSQKHKGIDKTEEYQKKFKELIENDLNLPSALQVFLAALDDFDFSPKKKISLLLEFDSVLGLGIKNIKKEKEILPIKIKELIKKRDEARKNKDWAESDILRNKIKEFGFNVEDTSEGTRVSKV